MKTEQDITQEIRNIISTKKIAQSKLDIANKQLDELSKEVHNLKDEVRLCDTKIECQLTELRILIQDTMVAE